MSQMSIGKWSWEQQIIHITLPKYITLPKPTEFININFTIFESPNLPTFEITEIGTDPRAEEKTK